MNEDQVFGVAFPVERWVKLVERKLEQGYEVILGDRNATLFMRGRGYEPCPYRIAHLLIQTGVLAKAGEHSMGTRYQYVPGKTADVLLKAQAQADPDEEDELLLDAGEDGQAEASEDSDDLASAEEDTDEDLVNV